MVRRLHGFREWAALCKPGGPGSLIFDACGVWPMRSKIYRRKVTLKRFALLGGALIIMAACGTVYRPGDERASCAELQSEIAANAAQIAARLAAVDAAEVSGTLRPSGTLAGMSFALGRPGDVERIEVRSLRRRNTHLIVYASNKGC